MALGAEDGVGQGGACFANFLMGRCSRLPWRHFHLCSFLFLLLLLFAPQGDAIQQGTEVSGYVVLPSTLQACRVCETGSVP